MKRFLIPLLILCLIALPACNGNTPEQTAPVAPAPEQPEVPEEAPEETPEEVPEETPPAEPPMPMPEFTADTLPVLDGSTATIPLSEALVQRLLGYTPEQAQEFVDHATTHYAYENLIAGECDIIFVTPPSADELSLMDQSGEEFEVVPVVKDAFVFLTGTENPVESLTVQQLYDIYTGKITDWSEVGGEKAAIIPYQRQDNSGSQTLMYKLLVPANEIMEAPRELVVEDMGGLVDAVSDYKTGPTALGYSVFYYASGMYVSDGSRLMAVDGVAPTAESIAAGDYPLTDAYYAVFRKDQPQDSPVRQLLAWILSDEGQILMQSAGYVPLRTLE